MSPRNLAVCVFVLGYVMFAVYVSVATASLPDRLATHFTADGVANGWSSRASFRTFALLFGLGFPLFIVPLMWAVRFFPGGLNLPNRDRWIAPDQRAATYEYLLAHAWRLACIQLGLVAMLNTLLIQANRQQQPFLQPGITLVVTLIFLVAVVVWIVALILRFSRK